MKIEKVYGKEYTFIDVRSPKEFTEDHIPGAINIPLFSNEERAIVGTLYKQVGKDVAIEKGLKIVGEKLAEMVKEYSKYKEKKLCIYCWRGGMRSGSVVSLLKNLKYDVVQLDNGYKDYRRFVREQFDIVHIPELVVLYGLTGVGKTEILQKLKNSIDLEGFAQHRGSVFGDIGLTQRSQKMFESLLLQRIITLQKEKRIFIEGEARKIGQTMIPLPVWNAMHKGKKVKVVCLTEERVERLYKEYCSILDVPILIYKIHLIEKFIGKKKGEELISLLQEGRIKEMIKVILLEYYDRLYNHTIEQKKYVAEVKNVEDLKRLFH